MTPEDIARGVSIVVDEVGDPRDPQNYVDYEKTVENIAEAIRKAVLQEREACAMLVEGYPTAGHEAADSMCSRDKEMAAAIRGRNK